MTCNARILILAACVSLMACDLSGLDTGAPAPTSVSGTTTFNVSAPNSPVSFTINGSSNPTLVVQRGVAYTFDLAVSGDPFYIMNSPGTNTANAYSNGVTGNGNSTGILTFAVPSNAPDTLYYDSSIYSGMSGTISVTN